MTERKKKKRTKQNKRKKKTDNNLERCANRTRFVTRSECEPECECDCDPFVLALVFGFRPE